MKQINVIFDDDEFARLLKRKGNKTWRAFILTARWEAAVQRRRPVPRLTKEQRAAILKKAAVIPSMGTVPDDCVRVAITLTEEAIRGGGS